MHLWRQENQTHDSPPRIGPAAIRCSRRVDAASRALYTPGSARVCGCHSPAALKGVGGLRTASAVLSRGVRKLALIAAAFVLLADMFASCLSFALFQVSYMFSRETMNW